MCNKIIQINITSGDLKKNIFICFEIKKRRVIAWKRPKSDSVSDSPNSVSVTRNDVAQYTSKIYFVEKKYNF